MNTNIKIFIVGVIALFGIFSVATPTPASALTCNSATLTGTVITGTPPTHARFTYSTSYSAVASSAGTPTTVQYFNTKGTFPIQQYIDNLIENTTYYYRLEVTNNYGSEYLNIQSFKTPLCEVQSPAPTVTISVPGPVGYNGSSTIVWSSTNATSCIASGDWSGTKATSGSQSTGVLTSSKNYTLTCTGPGGSTSNSASITVNPQPVNSPTVSLTADSTNVNYNGSTYVRWTTTNATTCSATGGSYGWSGTKSTSGSFYTGNLTSTTTYNINCSGAGGSTSDSITVSVNSQPLNATGNISATACTISNGASSCATYLTWTTNNLPTGSYTSVTKNNPSNTIVSTATSGYSITNLVNYGTTNFYLYNNGQVLDSTSVNATCATNTSWDGSKCATAAVSSPTISLSADSTNVNYNGSTYVRWTTTNATTCSATGGSYGWSGTKSTSGSFYTGNLTSTTTYNINCSGAGGSTSDSIVINVGSQPYDATGNISATSCTIPSGLSSCTSYLTWTTNNLPPSSYTSVTKNNPGNTTVSSNTSGFNVGSLINYGSTTFYLYNNGQILDSTSTNAICAANTNWDGSKCATAAVSSPTISLSADSTNVNYNGSTYVRWTTTNATSCIGSNGSSGWSGNRSTFGSFFTGNLTNTTTYNITCTNSNGGSVSDYVVVTVGSQPVNSPTVSLTADSTNVNYNGSTYVRWTTTNTTSCSATGGSYGWSGTKAISGSFYTGNLTNNTTYNIVCTNSSGSVSDSLTIYVSGNQPVNSPSVTTNGATSVGISYATLNGYVSSNGSLNVNAWFEWGTGTYYGNQTSQTNYGSTSGTSYTYYLSGLASGTTYYYRAVAQNTNGQIVYGSQLSFTTPSNNDCSYYGNCYNPVINQPTVNTYGATNINTVSATLNGYVNNNGSTSVVRWFEWGTNSTYFYSSTSKVNQGNYSSNFSDSLYSLSNNTIYYYRAVAQSTNGNIVYGNVVSFSTNVGGINTYGCVSGVCLPTAVTTIATSVGSTSARLNGLGLLSNTNAVYNNGYFEYGTTTALGRNTLSKGIGSVQSNPFYENLFGLVPNTTYYYRAVVSNQYGTSRGDILSFRTDAPYVDNTNTTTNTTRNNTTNNTTRNITVVSNTGTGTSRSSLVFLDINRNNEIIREGEVIEYIVNYKNVSSENLKDVVLRVFIPKELNFLETSRGYFSTENSTVVVNIENLNPQEEGSIRIRVEVLNSIELGKIIVVTANLVYTISDTNKQEEVFAYSRNVIERGLVVQQGALAFMFGNGFLPNTLLGWLLLILLLVLLILAARKAYYGSTMVVMPQNTKKEH